MRQRTKRPCSLLQPVSYSEEKKIFGEPFLRLLQNAALIALKPPEIIAAQILSDQAAGLLLALHGIGRDQAAFQRTLGQLAQQRLQGWDFVAFLLNGLLCHG